jgi:pyoverdine/dityrosine biosynthesis protein Dit1/alpha-ketoglutarate-dependent taurine dioxygenase
MAPFGEQFVSVFERNILCVKSDAERDLWKSVGRERLRQWLDSELDGVKPLNMVLPAFPFKSPNTSAKVLGTRPDAGEEVALKRLDEFCKLVENFYPAGAHIVIFSDGRVFNDLLGVNDNTVAEYSRICRELAKKNNLSHISFDTLENYVDPEHQGSQATLISHIVQQFLPANFDVDSAVEQGELKNTYVGFRSFLQLDLGMRWAQPDSEGTVKSKKQVENECKRIAKLMIVRNQAFSSLVSKQYPNHLRLSIHAGNMIGPKWSISLINNKPHADKCASATPWHNVLVQDADGEVYAVRRYEVNAEKYELVSQEGHPWSFREKGVVFDSHGSASNCSYCDEASQFASCESVLSPPPITEEVKVKWKHLPVYLEPLKPFGVMIRADPSSPAPSYFSVPAEALRDLVCTHTTVLLRGFAHLTREEYIEGTRRIGPLVNNPHGVVTDVKEEDNPKISVFTKEAMPIHFDGMFKIKMDNSVSPPKPVADVAFMQVFQCVQPPAPTDEGGITLFINTLRILDHLGPEKVNQFRDLNIGYYMPPSGMFGGNWMYFKTVDTHPLTGREILRIHEPWPQAKSEKFEILVKASSEDEEPKVKQFFDEVIPLCFDDRFAFRQSWELDDILFADNHAQLHTRTAYKTASRHLRRIHIQE